MKRKVLVATAVALGVVGVSAAHASPGRLRPARIGGSDTLFSITTDVIDRCITATGLTSTPAAGTLETSLRYVGGGSSFGGNRMSPTIWGPGAGQQQVASQSRFLSASECDFFGPDQGQGIAIALDGLSIFKDNTEGSACQVLRYKGCMTVTDRNDRAVLGFGLGTVGVDDGTGAAVTDDDAATAGIQYCFNHWSEALRIIYTGQHRHVVQDPCNPIPTTVDVVASRRCNSDVRRTLVDTWANMFDTVGGGGDGGCADGNCAFLKHAWRRDDLSGTTDTFLSLLGVPTVGTLAAPTKTFCNGIENEDLDPIRRDCNVDPAAPTNADVDLDSVCTAMPMRLRNLPFDPATGNPTGAALAPASPNQVIVPADFSTNPVLTTFASDLGLVLSIVSMPVQVFDANSPDPENPVVLIDPGTGQPYNPSFDPTVCVAAPFGSGRMSLAEMPFSALTTTQRCPSGSARSGNKCLWPTRPNNPVPGTANGWFNCRAKRRQRLVAAAAPWSAYDGRAYNRVPRHPQTGNLLLPDTTAGAGGIKDPRFTGAGDSRIHMMRPKTVIQGLAGHPTFCRIQDATRQIGCLVQADICSIGFAGLEGEDQNLNPDDVAIAGTNISLYMGTPNGAAEVQPTQDRVQDLADACGAGLEGRYPIARYLWHTAAKGFYVGAIPSLPGFAAQTFDNVPNQIDTDPGDDYLGIETAPADSDPTAEPDGVVNADDPFTNEKQLAKCFAHAGDPVVADLAGSIVRTHGFIPLPAGAHRLFQCTPTPVPAPVGAW